jgi:hypothetical protein
MKTRDKITKRIFLKMASPSFLYRWLKKSNAFVELVPFLSLHGFCEAISEMLLCNAFS